jgi:hypothetical protein
MPLFSTPTQFAALGLLFIAGWLFGLASHPGGRKWKERYAQERDAHATAKRDNDVRLAAAEKRAVELDRENTRLTQAATVTPVASVTTTTVPIEGRRVIARPIAPRGELTSAAARPAYAAEGTKRGWFDFNRR